MLCVINMNMLYLEYLYNRVILEYYLRCVESVNRSCFYIISIYILLDNDVNSPFCYDVASMWVTCRFRG